MGPPPPTPRPTPAPPTPSPRPTPPHPPPAPTPSPTPGNAHYGHPPCLSDEEQVTIAGPSSVVCARMGCDSSCPADVPAGATAQPECNDAVGACLLKCESDSECPPHQHPCRCKSCSVSNLAICPAVFKLSESFFRTVGSFPGKISFSKCQRAKRAELN